MGCSQSSEKRPAGGSAVKKAKSADKKEKVSSPLSSTGHNWKAITKSVRTASLHDLNVAHHYHLKPPSDWREWSPSFSKRYEIKYEIGRGAYGSVWRAVILDSHHPTTNHNAVAVKIVSKKETDDLGWEMAHREMQVLKELSHPNIVPFRDSFVCHNHIITVMDMCRGGELLCSVSEHVQIYTEQVVMRIVKNVLAGVIHMHSKGVCHRDLKPANLLLKKKLKAQEASCLEHIRHELEEKKEPDHHHHKPCFRSITSAGSNTHGSATHGSVKDDKPTFKSITSVGSAAHGSMGEHLLSHGGRMGSLRDIASLSSLRESEIAEYTTEDVVTHLSSTICICDFGMAIKFKPDEVFHSVEGLVGSPIYCSPELLQLMLQKRKGVMANVANQLVGCFEKASGYDARCDIWSLGIITYILLSGYHPALEGRGGPTAELSKVVKSLITEDFDFPADPWDKVTQPAKDFVKACLVRDYTKRPHAVDLQDHEWFTMSESSPWKRLDRPSASIGHHSQLDMKVDVLLKQDEPFGVELDEKTHQITHVTVGSKADQLGLEEGMQLLEIKSKDRALSLQEIDAKDLDKMLHSAEGASLKLKGEKDCVMKPLRKLLEADNVDCNPPICSKFQGLAALREVLQEREEAHWEANARAIEVDQELLRTSKEVLMTIESSLDPRDGRHETALTRLISDLRLNHPACSWVACHDSAAEMSDYVNDLENYQSYHIRFSLGSRGFLVVGTTGTKDKEQETAVHMNGKEVDGFRIEDTNLPRDVIQQLYKAVTGLKNHVVEAQWIKDFLSQAVPNKQWLVVVGTVLGESKTTSPSAPYLKFTFHHHKIHCFGFHQSLLRPYQTFQPYPPA